LKAGWRAGGRDFVFQKEWARAPVRELARLVRFGAAIQHLSPRSMD